MADAGQSVLYRFPTYLGEEKPMNENREYKSDVFSMLMENKSYALEVYNALNHSDYKIRRRWRSSVWSGGFPCQYGMMLRF